MICVETRKRQLIDIFFQYGLSISHHRVLEISTQGEALVALNMSEGFICPSVLQKGLFTTAAVDNATTSKQLPCLPDSYTNIKPEFIKNKPLPPKSSEIIVKFQDYDYLDLSNNENG